MRKYLRRIQIDKSDTINSAKNRAKFGAIARTTIFSGDQCKAFNSRRAIINYLCHAYRNVLLDAWLVCVKYLFFAIVVKVEMRP